MAQSADRPKSTTPGWLAATCVPDATLKDFFELSLDMLCVAGFDGHFKRLNPAWETVTGFSVEELTRRPYLDFIHPNDIERTNAEVAQQGLGHEVSFLENRFLCADGSYKWLRWTSKPQLDHQVMYAVARDVTKEKRALERLEARAKALEARNRDVEDFTCVMSHDMKEPLRAIEAATAFLMSPDQRDDVGNRYVSLIRDNVALIRDLGDDLLELSRISRGPQERRVVSASSLIAAVRRTMEFRLDERNADILFSRPDAWLACDPVRMKLVFENLISNGVKYNDKPNALVEISVVPGPDFHTVSVRDNGVGIDRRFEEKVFGVFQRLDPRDEYEGSGVGLTICKKIVESHGGKIWVESDGEGQGTTFFFTVPAGVEPSQA